MFPVTFQKLGINCQIILFLIQKEAKILCGAIFNNAEFLIRDFLFANGHLGSVYDEDLIELKYY